MGKKLDFSNTDQFILWAEIHENEKTSFNRAFGPFKDRAAAYRGRDSIIRQFKKSLEEQWYLPDEIEKKVGRIKWTTTKLWSLTPVSSAESTK